MTQHSDLPDEVITMAEDISFDVLLDHPATVNQSIRYLCAVRKALMDLSPDEIDGDLSKVERVVTRTYERIGFERRQAAFADSAYHPSAPHLN